jgi:hypothetical protein
VNALDVLVRFEGRARLGVDRPVDARVLSTMTTSLPPWFVT